MGRPISQSPFEIGGFEERWRGGTVIIKRLILPARHCSRCQAIASMCQL